MKRRTNHNAPATQVTSWHDVLRQGLCSEQERKVITYLLQAVEPKTSRQIAKYTNLERTSVTRTLRNLLDKNSIYVAKVDKCEVTGKNVQHYALAYKETLF